MEGPGRGDVLTGHLIQVSIGDLTFDVLVEGADDAPAVLLLHGFPQSSYQWRHQLPVLAAAGWRAVAPDQRGYSPGARPPNVDAYHVDNLVADVVSIADHLGAERFHLVGHDWGGVVAWIVAGRHPGRVASLTSVSTPHPLALLRAVASPSGDQAFRSLYVGFFRQPYLPERLLLAGEAAGLRALFANTAFSDRPAMEHYVQRLCEPGALTAALNWYRAIDVSAPVPADIEVPITVPTLYVWSNDDPALGREAAEATAQHVAGPYRFVELAGAGHWIPEDEPELFNRILLEHLASAS